MSDTKSETMATALLKYSYGLPLPMYLESKTKIEVEAAGKQHAQ